MYTTQFLKINQIGGVHYTRRKLSDTLVIYGIGAPITPDNGNLPDAEIIGRYSVDIFVPDYIGYGRSDGIFTPKNCIKTFLYLYDWFSVGCVGRNAYLDTKIRLKYKRIIIIGRSLGGTYVPLLPRFNNEINELAIFYPVVDSKSCGSVKGEETNADFLRSMKEDGYHHLYRGILEKNWLKHLENEDDLSPMDNIAYLEKAKLFVAHGKKDECINFSKSLIYFQKIVQKFPNKKNQFTQLCGL